MTYIIREAECDKAELDTKQVTRIVRRMHKAIKEANSIGLLVFGGSSSISLRIEDENSNTFGELICAEIDCMCSGGCGATHDYSDGLMRGEA